MTRLTVVEVEAAVDKVLTALAQVEAAKQNLLTSLKTLERLGRSGMLDEVVNALAGADRPSSQRSV